MTSLPRCLDWLRRYRRSAQGLERLWKPTTTTRAQQPAQRRRWTLLAITICLHVLLWSSVVPLVTMLALFAARSIDTTILPSTVLTIISAVASISYVILHSVVARRQNRLQHEFASRRFENACYVALRLAVALCILWLMTSGWNFIIAARQPTCLPESSSNGTDDGWKAGSSCAAERFSAAISFIALVASCTLFGILAVVRRPFEASLLGSSSNIATQHHYHNPFLHSRKLSHPEDGGIGVYNPALHRPGTSASTISSLASSSFFRPDTAMTEKNPHGGLTISPLSTPGPSFPSTPSTGDLVAAANSAHFSWVPSPRLSPTSCCTRTNSAASNALGIFSSPSLIPAPLSLLPAAPLPTLGSPLRRPIAGTRRVSSANSVLTTSSATSSSSPPGPARPSTPQRRARSYGHLSLMASGALPPASASASPPRLRGARSPPPLDSAWRAVHPHPPPAVAAAAVDDARPNVPRARPPSLPHNSPPRLRRPGEVGEARAQLTAAALASFTAAQAQAQAQTHGHGHRRKGSGPPPPAPVSVRPVLAEAGRPVGQMQAPLASPAVLCLQQRARAQRPLGGRQRCFNGGGWGHHLGERRGSLGGSSASLSGSGSGGTARSSSSPLSTMVRACEVEVEVLRGEMERAGEVRRGVLGVGDVGEQVSGLERSGRWCRVRRGFGGGVAKKEGRGSAVPSEEEAGDIAVEGKNWVRNASGEESVEEVGVSEGEEARGREDSGVDLDVKAVPSLAVSVVEQELPRRQLLPSWSGGVVAKTSPEQSFLDAVLAAGKVTPLLGARPGDDAVECLERSGTIVVRRARSLEELQGPGGHEDGGVNAGAEVGMRVGLGLSWVIGVGAGVVAQDATKGLQREEEVKPLDIKRVPRTRRRTVVLG